VNDLTPQSRRAFFEAHGRWPRTGEDPGTPRHSVTFTRATPAPTPVAPPVPFRTPEQEAWTAAYAGQGHGPLSCRWVQSGAQLRCEWLLPICSSR
jgi:hypothetical protein